MKKINFFIIFGCMMVALSNVAMSATMRPATSRTQTNRTNPDNNTKKSVRARTTATTQKRQAIKPSRTVIARQNTTKPTIIENLNPARGAINVCKAQYDACMDNYCNVLDEDKARCTCSANLKNYAKTEGALKEATEQLNEIAQNIQYIGLSANEIEALFTQTAAEITMQSSQDTGQIKSNLDRIKNMILSTKPATATTNASSISMNMSGLLDISINNNNFNLSTLFTSGNSNSSVNNQRGEQLYKSAAARCKASVLDVCVAQSTDISIITNAYDLAIDRDCVEYERKLIDANEQMRQTIKNATSVLQKARLAVDAQKNIYDVRGCVNALDSCMQDDFICGSDYENCLDPSGKYIANGEVVIGSMPTSDTFDQFMWDSKTNVADFVNATLASSSTAFNGAPKNIAQFLQNKIGYHDDATNKNYGFCIGVINQCQDLTYTGRGSNKKYNFQNTVIKEYLNRTLVKIKSKQNEILTEYAQTCITDVKSCIDKTSVSGVITNASINACRNVINTCRSLTNVTDMPSLRNQQWLERVLGISVSVKQPSEEDTPQQPDTPPADENPALDLAAMRSEDIARCNAIPGGRISSTGALCAVWGVSDIDALDSQAAQYGWPKYFTGGPGHQNISYYTGKQIDQTALTQLYVLRWAYLDALALCNSRGGTLDIAVGTEHSNSTIFCTIFAPAEKMTETECDPFQNAWPMWYGPYIAGGISGSTTVNGVVTERKCTYMPAGLYYTGTDLPGQCLPGMTIDQTNDTGNCVCEPGLEWSGAGCSEPIQ